MYIIRHTLYGYIGNGELVIGSLFVNYILIIDDMNHLYIPCYC